MLLGPGLYYLQVGKSRHGLLPTDLWASHCSCYHPQTRGPVVEPPYLLPGVMSLQPAVPRWGIVLKTPTFPTMGFFGERAVPLRGGFGWFWGWETENLQVFEVCQTVRCQQNSECATTISLMYLMCRWGVTPRIKHTKKHFQSFSKNSMENFRRYISTWHLIHSD